MSNATTSDQWHVNLLLIIKLFIETNNISACATHDQTLIGADDDVQFQHPLAATVLTTCVLFIIKYQQYILISVTPLSEVHVTTSSAIHVSKFTCQHPPHYTCQDPPQYTCPHVTMSAPWLPAPPVTVRNSVRPLPGTKSEFASFQSDLAQDRNFFLDKVWKF